MIKVGVTGGIGSGKSTVCKMFALLGIPVYDADSRAKALYTESESVKESVVELLGGDVYRNGKVDRKKIANKVFNDRELLKQLNGIIHPAVRKDFKVWLQEQNNADYIIKEAAVMIESGSFRDLDKLIVVSAPEELRIERVTGRDGSNRDDVQARINNQMTDEQREQYADFIINNSGGLEQTEKQVAEIHRKISERIKMKRS